MNDDIPEWVRARGEDFTAGWAQARKDGAVLGDEAYRQLADAWPDRGKQVKPSA